MGNDSRVLIVEDDALIAAALELAFADAGFASVQSVPTTAQAMASLGASNPSVLILDVSLADSSDGWGLAEVANQVCSPPPVIVFSTGRPDAIPEWVREAGPVVAKPADPDQVVKIALDALRSRGLKGALSGLIGRLKR